MKPEELLKLGDADWDAAQRRAEQDPLWQKAVSIVQTTPAIRLVHHSSRLSDALSFIGEMLQMQAQAKDALVRFKVRGMAELLDKNPDFLAPTDPNEREVATRFVLRGLEVETRRRVEQYPTWTLNQGLVVLCTRFDVFLEELVDAILRTRVELLYASSEAKSIHLKTVLEAGSTDALLKQFREKEVRAFSFEEIERRFDYLKRRLHLDIDRVFDWSLFEGEETKKEFAGWDLKRLGEVYDRRHRIVHRDEFPIGQVEELAKIQWFFLKIMWALSILAMKKHGLQLDGQQTVLIAETYERLKAAAGESTAPAGDEQASDG